MARLGGIQKAQETQLSSRLDLLERELRKEFELTCEQESLIWRREPGNIGLIWATETQHITMPLQSNVVERKLS